MTDESSNREQWLAQIKPGVKAKVGDQWKDARWSEYVKGVVWWLHKEKERDDMDTIDAAVGLIKYGIAKEGDLINVAGSPPNRKDFREALEAKGLPPIVCDLLFNKYVAPQQQQHGPRPNEIALDALAAERIAKLADFAQAEMDDRTKNKPMSEASVEWAESILASYRVQHKTSTTVNTDAGSSDDPPRYEWTIQTNSGEVWNKGEHRGTPGALEWLKEHFLDTNGAYELKVVTGASLPKVKGNRKSATGKADISIGAKSDINFGDTYTFVRGLIELKTDKYPLKTGQNLLELLALSTASSFQKAVVLLATNCNNNWEVFHFASGTEVRRQIYKHGRKAWEDFIRLVDSVGDRNYPDKFWGATLPSISDQDLEGFPETDRDRKKAKAEEEEAMLERFADQLENIYGERPVVPSWARAHQRIPDYYL